MVPRRTLALLALVLLLAPGATPAGPHAPPPAACVASERAGVTAAVPLELDGNHLYVETEVQGRGPFDFILDSGATVTAVDAGLARRLRRPIRAAGRSRGVGAASVPLGALPGTEVTLAGVRADGGRAMALPVDSVMGPFVGRSTQGVVGFPFFRGRVMELDFDGGCVRVHRPEAFEPTPGALVLPMEVRGGWPRVAGTLELADGRTVAAELMVDTGSRLSLLLTADFVRSEELLEAAADRVRGSVGAGIGGGARFDLARLPALRLDTLRYAAPVVGLSTGRGLRLPGLDGILGTEFLRRFRVHLDYAAGRLVLEPGLERHRAEEFDMSGLVLVAPRVDGGREVRVQRVAPGTPGARAGVRVGDRILAVDGEPTDSLSLGRVEALLEGPAGATRRLRIERDGRVRTLEVVLERLI